MKKIVSMLLALIMMMSLAGGTLAEEPIVLRFWGALQPEYGYAEIEKNFNEQFKDKGVQVEYVRYVNNADGNMQLETYLMAGGEIDVFIGYKDIGTVKQRVDAGLMLDMTDYLAARNFDPVAAVGAGSVSNFLVDGRYYAVPTRYENPSWMMVNVDMLKAAGLEVPYDGWTYEEFRDYAKKLTSGEGYDKVYGMFWGGTALRGAFKTLLGSVLDKYSVYKNDECTESNFDHPAFAATLQLMVDLSVTDGSAPSFADEMAGGLSFANMFLEGKAAMTMGISQVRVLKDIVNYPHDFTTALVPFPVPDASYPETAGQHAYYNGAGDTISVASKTEHPEEAVDFAIWYITEGMIPLASINRIPLYSEVDQESVIQALNNVEGVLDEQSVINYVTIDQSNVSVVGDRPYWAKAQIDTVMTEEIEAAMNGQKDVATALADMKTRADALIKDAMAK